MYFCVAHLVRDQTKRGLDACTLSLTAVANAAIFGVMVLVYNTVQRMQYT